MASKNNGGFYCLNCLLSFRSKTKLYSYESVSKNYSYFYVELHKKGKNILRHNQGEKYMKVPLLFINQLYILFLNKYL